MSGEPVPAAPRGRPWEEELALGLPPPGEAHGYWHEGKAVPCSREELEVYCRGHAALVWAPDRPGALVSLELPWLFEANQAQRLGAAEKSLGRCALLLLICAVVFLGTRRGDGIPLFRNPTVFLLLFFGLLPFVQSLLALRRVRRWTPEQMAAEAPLLRFQTWVAQGRAPATHTIIGILVVFGIWGTASPEGWRAALLDKEAVWAGEWWRLLSGPMLHAGSLHLMVNLFSLAALGRLVERVRGRDALLAVLASGLLAGSAASLVFSPSPSVGFSGAILALVGALLGSARAEWAPPGVSRSLGWSLGLIAVIGVIGHDMIDNFAHLGGLLAGLGCGVWLGRESPTRRPELAAGLAGAALLLLASLLCAWRLAAGGV